MESKEKEWYFSRSDAELYDRCPRARYHRTIGHTGRGLVKVGSSFEQSLGRIIHRSTEWILTGKLSLEKAAAYASSSTLKVVEGGEYPRKVGEEFVDQFKKEAQALAGGLIWVWGLRVLPEIRASYDVVSVEKQTAYRRDGLVLPTVADVVLRSKDDGTLVYPDWKTTAWVNADWMDQWNRAAQLFTTAKAVEQVLGEEVEYCFVQGLVKGRWQNNYQQSPLCWAYRNDEDNEWSFKYKSGKKWRRTSSWVENIPIQRWVEMMPTEIAMNLVPRTPPIIVNPYLAETWWRQRVIKEKRIQDSKKRLEKGEPSRAILDRVFPQHFDQCKPVSGFRCDYLDICHDPHGIGADPIGSGMFKKRPTYKERLKEESADEENV